MKCNGEHDLTTSKEVGSLLADLVAENELVVIDVTEAEFVDTSFLHNVVNADRLSRAHGTRVRLQLGAAAIARTLELGGVLERLDHVPTREQALAIGSRTS